MATLKLATTELSYYERNKQTILGKRKEYYQANKEKCIERSKKYAETKDKEKVREYMKEYMKDYYQEHKDKFINPDQKQNKLTIN